MLLCWHLQWTLLPSEAISRNVTCHWPLGLAFFQDCGWLVGFRFNSYRLGSTTHLHQQSVTNYTDYITTLSHLSLLVYIYKNTMFTDHIMCKDCTNEHQRGIHIKKPEPIVDLCLGGDGVRWKLLGRNMLPHFTAFHYEHSPQTCTKWKALIVW